MLGSRKDIGPLIQKGLVDIAPRNAKVRCRTIQPKLEEWRLFRREGIETRLTDAQLQRKEVVLVGRVVELVKEARDIVLIVRGIVVRYHGLDGRRPLDRDLVRVVRAHRRTRSEKQGTKEKNL